ncbi:MAG: cadherin-like beta sandwich domain-containing protein [Clostridia bacterium]|nr:cadherin-like beta sandwich domain-containing protein [Clostridia bacterium]
MKDCRILKKIFLIIFFSLVALFIKSGKVDAAYANITCPPIATAGTSMNIIVTGSAAQWNLSLKVNGTQIASSNELDSIENKTISFSGKYTPSSAGTVTVTLEGTATDADGTTIRSFASKSLSVSGGSSSSGTSGNTTSVAPKNEGTNTSAANTTSSDEPRLTNLGITPHDFSGFRSANTSYSVSVPNDCSSVSIYAEGNGSISGTGSKTLKEGTNKFEITVSLNGSSKTYTLSINRATADGEDVPNVTDEEEKKDEEDNDQDSFLLDDLKVEGYELSPKFDKKIKKYTVKLDKKPDSLDKLKELVKASFKDEKYKVEIITNSELKDDKNDVYVVIKDDEKEYSRYTITFSYEKEEEKPKAVGAVVPLNNDTGYLDGIGKLSYLVIAFSSIGFFIAFVMSVYSYVLSRKLRGYQEDEEYENEGEVEYSNYLEENENDDLNTAETFENNSEESERIKELEDNDMDSGNLLKESIESVSKLSGYRNSRKGRAGRHF